MIVIKYDKYEALYVQKLQWAQREYGYRIIATFEFAKLASKLKKKKKNSCYRVMALNIKL